MSQPLEQWIETLKAHYTPLPADQSRQIRVPELLIDLLHAKNWSSTQQVSVTQLAKKIDIAPRLFD